MSVVKLKNGLVVALTPTGVIVDSPDFIALSNGVAVTKEDIVGQDLFFRCNPDEVGKPLRWKGGSHGEGFDVVEILSEDEEQKYLK